MKDITDYPGASNEPIRAFKLSGDVRKEKRSIVLSEASRLGFALDESGVFHADRAVRGDLILDIADDAKLEPSQIRLLSAE